MQALGLLGFTFKTVPCIVPYKSSAEGNPVDIRQISCFPGQLDVSGPVDEGLLQLVAPVSYRPGSPSPPQLDGSHDGCQPLQLERFLGFEMGTRSLDSGGNLATHQRPGTTSTGQVFSECSRSRAKWITPQCWHMSVWQHHWRHHAFCGHQNSRFWLSVMHIPGIENWQADYLSCQTLDQSGGPYTQICSI